MPFKLNFLSFIGFPILISLAIYLAVTSSSSQVYYSSTVYASSFSTITNFTLDLVPDFHNFTFIGSATIQINVTLNHFKMIKRIYLDMNDQTINNISISNGNNETRTPIFTITRVTDDPMVELDLGRKLTIEVPPNFFQNCSDDTPTCRGITLVINFTTSSNRNGRGINWLAPNQTFSGKYPFFYTFCKPYRCRTLAPMMDSLGMGAPITISITVPSPMSVSIAAQQVQVTNNVDVSNITAKFLPITNLDYTNWTLYVYNVAGSTPSLLNIAIGVFEARDLGGGYTLLAEPDIIDNCSNNLAKFNDYIATAQNITTLPMPSNLSIMVMPMGYIESISLGPNLMFVPIAKVLNADAAKGCVWEIVFSSFFGVSKTPNSWSDWYMIRGLTRFLNYMARQQEDPEWALLYNNVTAEVLDSFFDQLCSKIDTCFLTELSPNLNGENENNFDYLLVPEYKGFYFMLFLRDQLDKLNGTSGDDNFMSFTIQLMNNSIVTSLQTLNDGNSGEFFTLFVQQVKALTGDKNSINTRKKIHWTDWWYSKKWNKLIRSPMNASALKQKADDLANIYLNGSVPSANKIADFSTWYTDAKMSFLLKINSGRINETLIKLLDATYLFSSSNDCFLMQTILESKIKTYNYSFGANANEILKNFVELAKKCGSRDALELELRILQNFNLTIFQTVFDNIKGFIHPLIKEEFQKSLSNNTTGVTPRSVEQISARAKVSQFLM